MKRLVLIFFLLMPLWLFSKTKNFWTPIYEPFDSLCNLCQASVNNPIQPHPDLDGWLREMNRIAEKRADNRLRVRVLFWKSWREVCLANRREALKKTLRALELVDSLKHPYDYHRLLWHRTICFENADFVTIYKMARRELEYYTSLRDYDMMAVMHYNIGRSYAYVLNYPKAREHYERSLALYKELGLEYRYFGVEQSIFWLYSAVGDSVRAREIYRKAIKINSLNNDTANLIVTYTNGKWAGVAPDGITKAYQLAKQWGQAHELFFTSVNYALYLQEKGKLEKALELFRFAITQENASNDNYFKFYLASLKGLSECHAQLGQLDSAYIWWRRYEAVSDSLAGLNRSDHFQELLDDLTESYEREQMEQLHRSTRAQTATAVLVGILLLGGAATGVWSIRLRQRVKRADAIRLKARMELEQTQQQLYRERSQLNEEQLLENSAILQEKRQMIAELGTRIEEHSREGTISQKARRDLQNLIRLHKGTEESLVQFYDFFNQVHPEFFQRLKEICPALTKGDLRLCAYLRTGLDTAQTAQLLSVKPSSVITARSRLRRKLGLAPSESLDGYIQAI